MHRLTALIYQKRRAWVIVLYLALLFSFMLFSVQQAGAADQSYSVPLVGEVLKNFPDKGRLLIKSVDGARQEVIISRDTELKGVLLLEEIKERQRVKVWYERIDGALQAVKIEVMAALGC